MTREFSKKGAEVGRRHAAGYVTSVAFALALFGHSRLFAMPIGAAIEKIASRLEAHQLRDGTAAGSWPDEPEFTGSIVAGMCAAHELTCDSKWRRAAESGGDYIVRAAAGDFFGDEAFALTRLSELSGDPCDNSWRTAVKGFYSDIRRQVGTEDYLSYLSVSEASTAVFYTANHVVAAYYVDAQDKHIWRQGLVEILSRVDDTSYFPVMALGVAVWALANTGPLNEIPVDATGSNGTYWQSVLLSDLPGCLVDHQVKEANDPDIGSFYWRFDHTASGSGEPVSGYTEDTVFATLGILAAHRANVGPDLCDAISSSRQALLSGVGAEGSVWERLCQEGNISYFYAGEMLQVLSESIATGDFNMDSDVDLADFAFFATSWGGLGSTGTACSCAGRDLNRSGDVDYTDLAILASGWLAGANCLSMNH
jgi:hypothetical protein